MKYTLLSLLALTILACQSEPTNENGSAPSGRERSEAHIQLSQPQMEQAGIKVGTPQIREMGTYLSCSGQIDVPPRGRHAVHSPVMGFVGAIPHLPGEYVRRGTRLTSIHHPELIRLQREFLETAARLPYLKKDQARKARLAESDAASQKAYEAVTAELSVAEARLRGLRAELELIGIDTQQLEEAGEVQPRIGLYAPVSGYLDAIPAQPGQLVEPQQPLFTLIDNSHVHLELEVYAKDLGKVEKGQPVWAQLPGDSTRLSGEVYLISPSVDLEKKTARVHVHLEELPRSPAVGTFMFAEIQVGSRSALTVPDAALIRSAEQAFVFLQEEAGFRRLPVELGPSEEGFWAVESERLDTQSDIALSGAYYINGAD